MWGTDHGDPPAVSTLLRDQPGDLRGEESSMATADQHAPVPAAAVTEERRIAHTGTLAHIAGACARHPWRVVLGWVSIFVVLIGLNAAFHGHLINDFKIPGSDTQKATDLIDAKFGGQKGAALRVVLAAPPGERLDTPQRLSAMQQMLAEATTAQKQI